MLTRTRDAATRFEGLIAELESALTRHDRAEILDAMGDAGGKFGQELSSFLGACRRLPLDDAHVQPWAQLYERGRVAHARGMAVIAERQGVIPRG